MYKETTLGSILRCFIGVYEEHCMLRNLDPKCRIIKGEFVRRGGRVGDEIVVLWRR